MSEEKGRVEFEEGAIRDFVESHIEVLREKGDELIFLCPFCGGGEHEEVSFNLNPVSGAARCWRARNCAWEGTVVKFVKDYLACDWRTAYKISGGEPPEDLDEVIGIVNRALGKLKPEHFSFSGGHLGVVDVFPDDAVPLYESDKIDDVYDWLWQIRGYDPDEFSISHDLYVVPDVDWFYGRVLFRVKTGDHDAYLAYAYDTSLDKKTINPPGEVLSRMLYNYDEVKDANVIFVTEGIFDAARCIERGFFAVSIFGTNMSLEQVFLLSATRATEIVMCLDEGTTEKSIKLVTMLAKYIENKTLSFMDLDVPGADPDSIAEEDFIRCYLNRKKFLRESDKLEILLKDLE